MNFQIPLQASGEFEFIFSTDKDIHIYYLIFLSKINFKTDAGTVSVGVAPRCDINRVPPVLTQ